MPEIVKLSVIDRRQLFATYAKSKEAKLLLLQVKFLLFAGLVVMPVGLVVSGIAGIALPVLGGAFVVCALFLYRIRSKTIIRQLLC
jgi:hypothetical protein